MEPLEVLAHLAGIGTPPDAQMAFNFSVGLENTITHIERETFPFLKVGGCELQFVYGPYGRGKSHFLHSVEQTAKEKGLVTAYVDCRMGQSPFKSLRDTYSMIAQSIKPPPFSDEVCFSGGIAGVIEHFIRTGERDEIISIIKKVRASPLLAPDYRNLVCALAGVFNEEDDSLTESLKALLNADVFNSVTLGNLYRSNPELPRPLGKLGTRNAGIWIRSLLSLPWILNFPGLVVLFDETERGHSFGSIVTRDQEEHLANLRNFVDYMAIGAFHGVSIYYAVVEDFIELARTRLEALSQRIERIRINNNPTPNPRAVWVSLDELTRPSPVDPQFFIQLGEKIVTLGVCAGLPNKKVAGLVAQLNLEAQRYADKFNEGAVREFVKFAAALVAQEVRSLD